MQERREKASLAILKVLAEESGPVGAARIMENLAAMGVVLQPRTIRFYLQQLDRDGLTHLVSRRRGRVITVSGREELSHVNVIERVGFVASRVDHLGYRMSFNSRIRQGSIVLNMALVDARVSTLAIREVRRVFQAGLAMGDRVVLARGGEALGGLKVPEGMLAIGTICSVTLNGIFLHEGIPIASRYGGLVEIRGGRPVRFVELIEYAGTTLDPLEAFIQAGMTSVRECASTGHGVIGASFREIPSVALEQVQRLKRSMAGNGLDGILAIGLPNRPLLDIPVAPGRTGMVVIGGLNPVAGVYESGVRVKIHSLVGLEDFDSFRPWQEVLPEVDGRPAPRADRRHEE